MAHETHASPATKVRSVVTEHRWARWTLIVASLVFLTLILILPLAAVFVEAFRKGPTAFFTALPVSEFSAFLIWALAFLMVGAAFFFAAFTTLLAWSAMALPISEALSLTLPAALEIAAVTPLPLLIPLSSSLKPRAGPRG